MGAWDAVIIPGHRASSQGAVSGDGTQEWGWACDVGARVVEALNRQDYHATLLLRADTKTGYRTLPEAVNLLAPRLALSIHFNSHSTPAAHGTETLCAQGSAGGASLAVLVQSSMVQTLGLRDRGIKQIKRDGRGGHLLWATSMPCVLVEPGFGSNENDWTMINHRRQELADAIATGVAAWLGGVA